MPPAVGPSENPYQNWQKGPHGYQALPVGGPNAAKPAQPPRGAPTTASGMSLAGEPKGLCEFLVPILIPLCIWGMLSALLMHLIEVRSLFIAGGEWRLRVATLAFTAGVILVQRLGYLHGKSESRGYGWALGAVMTLFLLQNAFSYRLPAPPMAVFIANEALFLLLFWVGARITRSCSVDDVEANALAAESGIFHWMRKGKASPSAQTPAPAPEQTPELNLEERLKVYQSKRRRQVNKKQAEELSPKERERLWRQRLPAKHPGRVIFLFSLVAIPAFGLGLYLFSSGEGGLSLLRLGICLFTYLWCALALLFLSSFSQLRRYFEQRQVTLPDRVGLGWLSIGFVVVTLVSSVAFLLPQPPSVPALYIRERIFASYRGAQSRMGVKEQLGKENGSQEKGGDSGQDQSASQSPSRGAATKRAVQNLEKDTGIEQMYKPVTEQMENGRRALNRIFEFILKVVYVLGAIAALVVLWLVAKAMWDGFSGGLAGWKRMREPKAPRKAREQKKPSRPPLAVARFRTMEDPFEQQGAQSDGNALVRYLWEAMLAYCADAGSACQPEQTPLEFLGASPPPLAGFEVQARYIADMFLFSEYSGAPIPESELPGLRRFWSDLQSHARKRLG